MEHQVINITGNTCTGYDDWANHLIEYMDGMKLKSVDRKVQVRYNNTIVGEYDFKTGTGFIKTGLS